MKYEILPNGNLKFSIHDAMSDFPTLLDIKDFHGGDDNASLCEFLEKFDYSTNGHFYDILPEDVGALTDAPMLTDEIDNTENGDIVVNSNVWWYPEYEISNWLDVLISNGSVIFTKA